MQAATGADGDDVACSGGVLASFMADVRLRTILHAREGNRFPPEIIECEREPNGETARIGRQPDSGGSSRLRTMNRMSR